MDPSKYLKSVNSFLCFFSTESNVQSEFSIFELNILDIPSRWTSGIESYSFFRSWILLNWPTVNFNIAFNPISVANTNMTTED